MADTAVRDKFVFPGAENIVVSQNISFLRENVSEFIFRIDIKQKQSIIAQEQGDAIKACGQRQSNELTTASATSYRSSFVISCCKRSTSGREAVRPCARESICSDASTPVRS